MSALDYARDCDVLECESVALLGHAYCSLHQDGVAVPDVVNHPAHYTDHPSGVECIAVAEHMNFCLGNVIKYVWRAGSKGNQLEDLRKAAWYLAREIARLEVK